MGEHMDARRRFCVEATGAGNGALSAEMAKLAAALQELEAIKASAQSAAEKILSACEGLMAACEGLAESDLRVSAEEAALTIMTGCSFHDMIGQRTTKVSAAVEDLLATQLGHAPEPAEKAMQPAGMPRLTETRTKQREAVLDDAGLAAEALQQDQVDALLGNKKT